MITNNNDIECICGCGSNSLHCKSMNGKKSIRRKNKTFQETASGIIRKRNLSKYEKPIYAVWELFSDYSETSTLHGIRYIGEKRRHWCERFFWVIAVFASIGLCGYFILGIWKKWQELPVIVAFAEKTTPVWDIPFPAITICSDIKINSKLFNYTEMVYKKKLNETELMYMRSLSRVCNEPIKNRPYSLEEDTDPNDSEIYNMIEKASPKINHTFINCKWKDRTVKCSKYFNKIWTEEGICYSFNLYNSSKLYREEILNPNLRLIRHNNTDRIFLEASESRKDKNVSISKVYPHRVGSASDSLDVILRVSMDDKDYLCSGMIQSFKIIFHTSAEMPQVSKCFYRIPLNTAVFINVKPNIMSTTPSLKSYDSERRQCFFEDERNLLYFKKYTQRNCQFECLVNSTIRVKKCAPFGMPRPKNIKLCKIQTSMSKTMQTISLKDSNDRDSCNCLPACNSVSYEAELSHAKYDYTKYSYARKMFVENQQFVQLSISYKENQFITSRRSALYGTVDFLSSCGGLLGLFLGFSFLSIVELIYYCTLRLGCNFHKRRMKKKKTRSTAASLGVILE